MRKREKGEGGGQKKRNGNKTLSLASFLDIHATVGWQHGYIHGRMENQTQTENISLLSYPT